MFSIDLLTYLLLILYCTGSITIGETIQITDSYFPYPCALKYLNTSQYLIFILPILVWKCYRTYFNLPTNIIRREKQYNAMLWFFYYTLLGGLLTSVIGVLLNISLNGNIITVPTSTAISGMRPVSVFILSVLFLKQKLNSRMIFAMVIALIGIVCFVLEKSSTNHVQHSETHDTYYGILLTITWTILGSIWEILLKKTFIYCFEADRFIIGCILSTVYQSLVTLVLFPWILFYPNPIQINSVSTVAWNWVIINGMVQFLSHGATFGIIGFKSPLYLSIASSIQIPIAFVVDVFVHDYEFNIYAVCGAIFIMISFIILEVMKPSYEFVNICIDLLSTYKCKKQNVDNEKTVLLPHITDKIIINDDNYGALIRAV